MTQQPDFSTIKAEVESRLLELTERANEIEEDLSAEADDDWEENAVESEDDEVLERIGQVTLDEIAQIKRALGRIESGTYGTCSSCGKPITPERLEAIPFSTRCLNCV